MKSFVVMTTAYSVLFEDAYEVIGNTLAIIKTNDKPDAFA